MPSTADQGAHRSRGRPEARPRDPSTDERILTATATLLRQKGFARPSTSPQGEDRNSALVNGKGHRAADRHRHEALPAGRGPGLPVPGAVSQHSNIQLREIAQELGTQGNERPHVDD